MTGADCPTFSDAERAAFALANAATRTPAAVTDELFAAARPHFSDAQLVEIAAAIALENFRSRLNRVFDVPAMGHYCPMPDHQA